MSEQDGFVTEVNDELRRDTSFKQLRKYRYVIGAVIIGAIGFVGFSEFQGAKQKSAGEAQYLALEKALKGESLELGGEASALMKLQSAHALAENGDMVGAKAILEAVSIDRSESDFIRQLASWKILLLDDETEFGALANPDSAFSQFTGLVEAERALKAGDHERMITALQALASQGEFGQLQGYIENLIILHGGELPQSAEEEG